MKIGEECSTWKYPTIEFLTVESQYIVKWLHLKVKNQSSKSKYRIAA